MVLPDHVHILHIYMYVNDYGNITAQVRKGLELVNNKKGTLIVIMRYTGDVLLFVSLSFGISCTWPFANPSLIYTLGPSQRTVCSHKPRPPSQNDSCALPCSIFIF